LPDAFAIGKIESRYERRFLRIALNDYEMFVDDGRATEAPVKVRTMSPAAVEDTQILFPQKFSVKVEALKTFLTK
jgi:hypothetical protein